MIAGDSLLIVGIVLARLLVPLLIPRFPLVIIVALLLDAFDNSLLAAFTDVDLGPDGPYQSFDKALDIYYLAIAYESTLRNWTSIAAVRVAQFLFYYRLVGVLAFELTGERSLLLVFPNTFEYFFIAYSAVALRYDPATISPRGWILTAAGIWIFIKLPQEYWIHVAQLDFTDAVADHPWFGVACAAGILLLLAILWFVVRPRLRPPDHAWTFKAEPVADRAPRAGIPWTELGEKVVLLALISIIFSEILPHMTARPVEIAVAVAVIVAANTAISAWEARRDAAALGFAALLVTNLGLIFVVSRFFTAAEDFPLGTALFFAFLITLLISLFDQYKPVFNARLSSPKGA